MTDYWNRLTQLATAAATAVGAQVAQLEAAAKNAASDLAQQHRLTVEAKRETGDANEEAKLVSVSVPRIVSTSFVTGLKSLAISSSNNLNEGDNPDSNFLLNNNSTNNTDYSTYKDPVLPWNLVTDSAPGDELRTQILALSLEKRNFTASPPEGTDFVFNLHTYLPTALAILKVDANLDKMRFALVPKVIKDSVFWENYFYRVTRLQQSFLLLHPNNSTTTSASTEAVDTNNSSNSLNTTAVSNNSYFNTDSTLSSSNKDDEGLLPVTSAFVDQKQLSTLSAAAPAPSATLSLSGLSPVASSVSIVDIPDSLDDEGLVKGEYAAGESFGADWEQELQNELDEA
ncbi:hypothetical protein HK100_012419 [Physocladia obscura]|uniref:BSD domain-containing protein n=1 Tax=Physocladia obscura TaxID=109957 RepID=A0AAD5T9S8_9FUNG|nr:hypothetical protein HK100_012419 [Physocladia obscura]